MFSTFTRFYYDTEDKSYNLLPYKWLLLDHSVLKTLFKESAGKPVLETRLPKSRFQNLFEISFLKDKLTVYEKYLFRRKENKKLVKLLLAVTITFASCILPYHTVALWVEFGSGISFSHIEDLSVVTFFVLYVNTALNPLLYNLFSSAFRLEFRRCWDSVYSSFSDKTRSIKVGITGGRKETETLCEVQLWWMFIKRGQQIGPVTWPFLEMNFWHLVTDTRNGDENEFEYPSS